jgi:hypothetical protein
MSEAGICARADSGLRHWYCFHGRTGQRDELVRNLSRGDSIPSLRANCGVYVAVNSYDELSTDMRDVDCIACITNNWCSCGKPLPVIKLDVVI